MEKERIEQEVEECRREADAKVELPFGNRALHKDFLSDTTRADDSLQCAGDG